MPPAFEYKTAVMSHGFLGRHKGELKRGDLEVILSRLGRERWELVHVWFDQKLQGEKDGHLLIFRRELPEQGDVPEPAEKPDPFAAFLESPGGER